MRPKGRPLKYDEKKRHRVVVLPPGTLVLVAIEIDHPKQQPAVQLVRSKPAQPVGESSMMLMLSGDSGKKATKNVSQSSSKWQTGVFRERERNIPGPKTLGYNQFHLFISGTGYSLDSQNPKAITSSTFHLS